MTVVEADNMVRVPPYSIKLEGTAKGARITVHIYGPDGLSAEARKLAVQEVVQTYLDTEKEAQEKGVKLAPTEAVK